MQVDNLRCPGQPRDTHTQLPLWGQRLDHSIELLQERVWEAVQKQPRIWVLEPSMCWGQVRGKGPEETERDAKHKSAMSGKPQEVEHFSRRGLKIKRLSWIWPFYLLITFFSAKGIWGHYNWQFGVHSGLERLRGKGSDKRHPMKTFFIFFKWQERISWRWWFYLAHRPYQINSFSYLTLI